MSKRHIVAVRHHFLTLHFQHSNYYYENFAIPITSYTRQWLSKLNQTRKRTVELSRDYREKGNKHFDEPTGQNDLAADYYTHAIFSAPKNSVELALAHANRAACCVTSDRFYEVRMETFRNR